MKKKLQHYSPLFWLLRLVFIEARLPFLLSCFDRIANALIPVAIAAAIGGVVGVLSDQSASWQDVWPWIAILIVAHLLNQSFVFNSFKNYLYQKRLERALDEPILKKISRLPLKYFEDARKHDLFARTVNPSQRVQGICEDILHTAGSWLQMIFLVIYIGHLFWWLGLLFILLSLVISRFELSLGRRIQENNRKLSVPEREKNYMGQLMTDRKTAMEVKVFSSGKYFIDKWQQWFSYIHHERWKFDLSILLPVTFLYIFQGILLFGGILLVAWQVRSGGGDVALLTSGIVAVLSFLEATDMISWNARDLGESNAYLEEVQETLQLPEERTMHGSIPFPAPMVEGIQFENVNFTYPGEKEPVLQNVSFHIQPGEKIALVGANGSGKSTLMKILLGLYEPDSGNISIDGISISEMDPVTMRKAMSVVFQDFGKYSFTAQENIGLGQIERLDDVDAIETAAKAGGAHEFLSRLPEKYETPFGRIAANGHEPSGGEWQRIAISRGLLRKAPILIFDEPTSALDPMGEVRMYEQIREVSQGQTAILVTHRLASVHTCDRIIVLDEGKVVESGTHQSLIDKKGLYAEMYSSQASWYKEVAL